MIQYRKRGDVPSDPSREFVAFSNSIAHRVIHNDLVGKLVCAQEQLETSSGDDLIRVQGRVAGLREALLTLHQRDTTDVKKAFELYE